MEKEKNQSQEVNENQEVSTEELESDIQEDFTNIDDSFMDRLAEKNEYEESKNFEKEVGELKDKLARSQAEFQNYKKRVDKEKYELTTFANEKIICELLTSLDNLDRALDAADDIESGLYKGVELTRNQLKSTLEKFGLIEVDNSLSFDPNFHHAVMQEDGEIPGKILDVFQKGYMLKDKLLRASMVKVSK